MTKRERRSRKQLLEKLQRVVLPPCALAEGTSRDYSSEPEPDQLAFKPPGPARPSTFELISEAQTQTDEVTPFGILGLLSEQ